MFSHLRSFNRYDFGVILALFALLYAFLHIGHGMWEPLPKGEPLRITLDPLALPAYVGRSVLRMFLALGLSLIFSLVYGSLCAKSRSAERILILLLDILQSVPVLGFLSATVVFFMALFPNSMVGLELTSIFAIFTSQAWNLTFAFYHSLITLPSYLVDVSHVYHLTRWQRFWRVEVPSAMPSLVWNGMMSFAGGWFFLVASEAVTVFHQDYRLPGLGSYMATAIEQGNLSAMVWAITAMVLTILVVDQLFWRPVVAWSQKFRIEETKSELEAHSWVLERLRRAQGLRHLVGRLALSIGDWLESRARRWEKPRRSSHFASMKRIGRHVLSFALGLLILFWATYGTWVAFTQLGMPEMGRVVGLGVLTFLRVVTVLVLSTFLWLPIGVMIGLKPRVARFARPLVQIVASFPANMFYPLLALLFLQTSFPFALGSIIPMSLGAQWYLLFNCIAGTQSLPSDLLEASRMFRLHGWQWWRQLILPGIFPHWVTGAITAWGGAWNASIVAEVITWHEHTLTTPGLGAYITRMTSEGNTAGILWGITVMSAFVVLSNRLFWKRLYALAEARYKVA